MDNVIKKYLCQILHKVINILVFINKLLRLPSIQSYICKMLPLP